MVSIICSQRCNWSIGAHDHLIVKGKPNKTPCFSSRGLPLLHGHYPSLTHHQIGRRLGPICSSAVDDAANQDDSEDGANQKESPKGDTGGGNSETLRENLERIVGTDDSAFNGTDLATLIRNKYGRSYDVQLIKKEFMGRNFLAMNVMWKYREQRSFPLTEEEYILRLDDVANSLKCWGAVAHIRNSLEKRKERPRIGKGHNLQRFKNKGTNLYKAVSIFIDMDESGGRANEWIYK